MRKLLSLLLAFCLLSAWGCAEEPAVDENGFYTSIPSALRITHDVQKEKLRCGSVERAYPRTVNDAVNAELTQVIDSLADEALPYMPTSFGRYEINDLTADAAVSRTGTKWASFMLSARIGYDRSQIYVRMTTRTYDLVSGRRLFLTDLFPDDSGAWDFIASAVRAQLSAYFPQYETPEDKLSALCLKENLMNADFALGVNRLTLYYHASDLYPDTVTLMKVYVYYRDVRSYMKDEAAVQTDNSKYKLICFTFDDGPARSRTFNLLDVLRNGNASATFFVLGERISSNEDVIAREHDCGHTVATHGYEHVASGLTAEKVAKWMAKINEEMNALTGMAPSMMRAPGGHEDLYIKYGANMPMIHWGYSDGGLWRETAKNVSDTLMYNAADGLIILSHDITTIADDSTALLLARLEKEGYLCVSVDELYEGELTPNEVYYGQVIF